MAASVIHKHIRASALVGWIVVWNVLFIWAFWMNGGFQPVPGRMTLVPVSVACLASAIFAALIASSTAVQRWVLRPDGDTRVIRANLWLIVLITAALGVGSIVFMRLPAPI